MQTTNQNHYSLPMLRTAFKVFTAYEDHAAFDQASKIEAQLKALSNDEMAVVNVALKFSLFRHEESWRHAAAEAANADMIIIAASNADLPFSVQSWIECLPSRDQSGQAALVALLQPKLEGSLGEPFLAAYLRAVANDKGLDFFCNQATCEQPAVIVPFPQMEVSTWRTQLYPVIYENWGIND